MNADKNQMKHNAAQHNTNNGMVESFFDFSESHLKWWLNFSIIFRSFILLVRVRRSALIYYSACYSWYIWHYYMAAMHKHMLLLFEMFRLEKVDL